MNFLEQVQKYFQPDIKFNTSEHVCDVIQAVYLFQEKHSTQYTVLNNTDRFALFTAAMLQHACYSGVTDDFLIKIKHPRAIRYNDQNITQSYMLAKVKS